MVEKQTDQDGAQTKRTKRGKKETEAREGAQVSGKKPPVEEGETRISDGTDIVRPAGK